MQQWVHPFQWLEAVETMTAYIVHNMNGNKKLLTNFEMTRSEIVAARKLAGEGVCLLRKAEEGKETS